MVRPIRQVIRQRGNVSHYGSLWDEGILVVASYKQGARNDDNDAVRKAQRLAAQRGSAGPPILHVALRAAVVRREVPGAAPQAFH
jgi:hypothetical protein